MERGLRKVSGLGGIWVQASVRVLAACLLFGGFFSSVAEDGVVVVYETGFEFSEGYREDFPLIGQNGWVGLFGTEWGNGGNGIVQDFIEGLGQQAFLGFSPPEYEGDAQVDVWHPLQFRPLAEDLPIVTFSVFLQIFDSTNDRFDCFRWSVFNMKEERLFTIDFDNLTLEINYLLENDEEFRSTGFVYELGQTYDLVVTMNFKRNLWSASMNGTQIIPASPMMTSGLELTLGDIAGVWVIDDVAQPGDNFMVFDEYWVTADSLAAAPAVVQPIQFLSSQGMLLRVFGEPSVDYAIEVTDDFQFWNPLKTNTAPASDGVFEYLDSSALDFSTGYYRVRALR